MSTAHALPDRARSVECAVADFTSVARGKIVARADFDAMRGCRLPSVVLGVTLTGGEPDAVFGPILPEDYRDVRLVPDLATAVPVPGRTDRVSVICEPAGELPRPGRAPLDAAALSPRAALRRVLARLASAGLRATVAPELEFFLVERSADGGLRPAGVPGGAGAREHALEIASLERTAMFAPYFDALFDACAAQRIPVTGHGHESAPGQYEVNFAPGEPLAMADAVWRFKRLARETAVRHGFLASFIAKPFAGQPGTGMHWHASLQHAHGPHAGLNAFVDAQGRDRPQLAHFIGGLQAHAPAAMALLAPWAHSFERLRRSDASPTDARWGDDDRAVAFRLPASSPANRRIEHRLPGGDASPYLTLASMLGTGLLGLQGELPRQDTGPALPLTPQDALDALHASATLRELLGEVLVDLFVAQRRHELTERAALADPHRDWDLRHLVEQA
ncbi:MAG: hypothetical protein RL654_3112 [Pseudomonadota bacterium]|jgi:glutamine synthetase